MQADSCHNLDPQQMICKSFHAVTQSTIDVSLCMASESLKKIIGLN